MDNVLDTSPVDVHGIKFLLVVLLHRMASQNVLWSRTTLHLHRLFYHLNEAVLGFYNSKLLAVIDEDTKSVLIPLSSL